MMDERYPIMELEMGGGVSRTSIYTLEIKLDSWDKETKEKFMSGDIFKDSELRDYAKTILKKYGLKDAHIASGWGCKLPSSGQTDQSFHHESGDGTWNPLPYESSYKGANRKVKTE